MTAAIEFKVYSGTLPSQFIADLAGVTGTHGASDRYWLHQLNDPGSGGFKLHPDAPVLASPVLAYDNIVRCSLYGTEEFAFIIEDRDLPPAPEDEEVARVWTVSGRGVVALLEDAIVFPEVDVEGSTIRQRSFNFTSLAYDDSTWTSAVQIVRQDAGTGAYTVIEPPDWPDPLAYWIWSRAMDGSNNAPVGTSYFRTTFTLTTAKVLAVYAACDNAFRLWIDGELVHEDWPGDNSRGWSTLRRADVRLGAGEHQIAVEAHNFPYASGLDSPAGLLVSILEIVEGAVTATVILRSDASWLALDYPVTVPGMTIGMIWRILIEEAQARGALVGITRGFTDALDSNNSPWIGDPDISLDIGTNLLDALETFIEQYVDTEMTPTLTLNLYNKGTMGTVLTATVSLAVGVDFEMLGEGGGGHLTNAILARDATGVLTTREDTTSLGARKRKETYVELGLAPNESRAQAMSDEIFIEFAYPVIEVSAIVKEGSGPYSDWRPGDTIRIPDQSGTATDTTVVSITISEDAAGNPIYHVEGMQTDASS